MFDKGGNNTQWRKHSLFNKCCWENWTVTSRRMELNHFLTPYIKINSKWKEDLTVRQKMIKILAENTGSNLLDAGHTSFLLDMFPGARETKVKINYWDIIKMASAQ